MKVDDCHLSPFQWFRNSRHVRLLGTTDLNAVDQELKAQDRVLEELREHLHAAQSRMKQVYDKHHTDREFMVGDWVYLKLQP